MKKNSSKKKNKPAKKNSAAKPQKASSIRITQEKLDIVRQTIISLLWTDEEVALDKLQSGVEKEVGEKFSGDFKAHYEKSMEGLLKHKLIEDVPNKRPKMIRLAQRIDV